MQKITSETLIRLRTAEWCWVLLISLIAYMLIIDYLFQGKNK